MTAKRDSLFSSASVSRAQGASIVRTPSRETLAVHPLLNPGSSAPLDSTKYVPYTPRQRPATTGPQAQLAPPHSTAPAKSQLTNLRTIAQDIGLEANSIGWAILEKISYEGDTSDEWSEIWNALTKLKATLLLPSELSSGHDLITPEFVQDHLILCDLASRENTPIVTLSGLRGQLVGDIITFRSTLHRSTKAFQALVAPSTSRAASLDALPPLPGYPPESSYPSFTVSAFSAALPFPSRATKPSLPPRPGTRSGPTPRLSTTIASLFGQRPSSPPPPLPPTTTTTAPPSVDADTPVDISALVIDTVLSRADIATAIMNALRGEIAIALNEPPWLVERVHTFTLPYFPFVKVPVGKKKLQDIGGNPNRVVYAVNGALDKPEELADKFQAFYRAVEAELREGGHGQVQETREDGADTSRSQDSDLDGEMSEEANEARIRDVLETVESTLCTLLYDRLFLPSTSDDASHNEALSSRIAALNMLDLALEHLDIDVGDANQAEVDVVVRTCGQSLSQLDLAARSPREKAAVLVCAHKLVVESLSKIPPVRLKSREDDSKELTKSTNSTGNTSISSTAPDTATIPTARLSTSPDRLSTLEPPPPPETTPQSPSSPVSGDVLLPILIFSVVKANPSRLVSHLLFTQRFRNQSFGGEESYCLINLMAVAEFLENVDLGALGLGESEKKVPSTADLTPIPIARPGVPESPIATTLPGGEFPASLRGRVEQGVDAIAGSANKVILGVVDTSFGVLRALLPGQTQPGVPGAPGGVSALPVAAPSTSGSRTGTGADTGSGSGMVPTEMGDAAQTRRPGLGLLRRETGSTGFSIAGLTVALPGTGRGRGSVPEEGQREMVEVMSRPASLKSHRSGHGEEDGASVAGSSEESGDEREDEDGEGGDGEDEREGEGEEQGEEESGEEGEEVHDARSIKSFESMLSSGRTRSRTTMVTSAPPRRRKRLSDLTDRLTHGMAGMSRRVQGVEGRSTTTTLSGRLPPPNRRFVECTEQDIRVSEVGELLREYQRLVEVVRSMGGFQE